MLIRPIQPDDLQALFALTKLAGHGMLSLPPDEPVLARKIEDSIQSFAGNPPTPQEETFLFAMIETATGKLVGTTGIVAHVGLSRPFYSYKISTLVQANRDIGAYSQQQVLHMVNDYTGSTEICSLLLHPDYRRDGLGRLLSRCRYLMLAEFPELFSDTVIAEIRGTNDGKGNALFYDHLAKHFFRMSYAKADAVCGTQGNQIIADLMPRYPIYVCLLPEAAQAIIGKPFHASEAAMNLLLREGFTYEGYIDVFDAGPTLQCDRSQIRGVRHSHRAHVRAIVDAIPTENTCMISNTQIRDFRMVRDAVRIEDEDTIVITHKTAEKLTLEVGHAVRYTPT